MSVDWNGYEPYVPPVVGPRRELSRRQAEDAYEHLMAAKRERIEMLQMLLRDNGIELKDDDTQIELLSEWFRANVERSGNDPDRLRNIWYAVVNDVALFLGDVIIHRFPGVQWQLFVSGKRDVAYQRHVLVGFTSAPNPKYYVDIDRLVATYGYRASGGEHVPSDYFLSLIRAAGSRI